MTILKVWHIVKIIEEEQSNIKMRDIHEELRKTFKIPPITYYDWKEKVASGYQEKGKVVERKRLIDKEKLAEAVKDKPDAQLKELAESFHLGLSYGVSEASCYKIVKWVENTLIKCEENHIPGKKALLTDAKVKTVLFDATESPIERPKKNRKATTPARKSVTRSRARLR